MAQRHLAAIMFTDIVGYTTIMQHSEERGRKIRERHRSVFAEYTEKYGGQILQYFGDGTLSIYPSAVAAVECAVEMQRQFKISPEVPLRMGIHTGDITYDKEEAYGHGMNVAARIEPICVPGGIFISEKVFDDIRNHTWLDAVPLGPYQLKNVDKDIELFAVSNKGLNVPDFSSLQDEEAIERIESTVVRSGNKKKGIAAILAILFGMFGLHRFYLGDKKSRGIGIALLTVSLVGIFTGIDFMVAVPAILGFIDAVLFMAMSRLDFDRKYNEAVIDERVVDTRKRDEPPIFKTKPLSDTPLNRALRKVQMRNYEGAIDDFERFLEEDPADPLIHFNLATCHAMLENADQGFNHIALAVKYGFDDFVKISNHYSLAYLRSRKEWDQFVENGYRHVRLLPSPGENLLNDERPLLLKKLEKIEELGEMREKGLMTDEEFLTKKRDLLDQ
ncbi:MAG: NINE protein [Saprospiraceae bacterium]|nr:NINE protein [Saprospiraceae bacterium]